MNKALINAIYFNDEELVKYILDDPNESVDLTSIYLAIYIACKMDYVEVMCVLLADSRVNPSAVNNLPIRWAAAFGYEDVVLKLLKDPRVDASNVLSSYKNINQLLDVWKLLKYQKLSFNVERIYV